LVYLATQLQGVIMPPAIPAAAPKPVELSEIALDQNHPNPFNPATDISFSLPSAARVTLEIYNILGERVATLVDSELGAGSHTVTWNSTDISGNTVASGVYFYRLQAGETVMTKKMVLLQ
jgi:hypothetical protein